MISIILLILFAVLQIADGVTTITALKSGRSEGNPILLWAMNRVKIIPALVVFKLAYMGLVGGLVYYYPSVYLDVAIGVLCGIYCWVIYNNVK